jgi:hypothetical protein
MKAILFKLLGRFVSHEHKIVKIRSSHSENGFYLYHLVMDCHVAPEKMVLVNKPLCEGHSFDPHFSNSDVVARFQPTVHGWENGKILIKDAHDRWD